MKNFIAHDRKQIFFEEWLPEGRPVAIIQIIHGMAEHSGCYRELAEFLKFHGFAVFANDQRAHGRTADSDEDYGHLDGINGWRDLLEDIHRFNQSIKKRYPDIPLILMGHSMGSFIARAYISDHGENIDGVILSATDGPQMFLNHIGSIIAGYEIRKHGSRYRSKLLTRMSFGSYNRHFTPNRTEYDWLSRDEKKVDEYGADKRCGGTFTSGFFRALLYGIMTLYQAKNLRKIPHSISFLFLTGERDPVSGFAERIWKVIDIYERNGIFDIEAVFYPDSRHDLKLELNREMIFQDILTWLKSKLKEWQ